MKETSGSRRKGGGGKGRCVRRRAGGSQQECARYYALCQLDLEFIIARRLRVGERRFRGAAKSSAIRGGAGQTCLGGTRAPWLGCNASERQPCRDDPAAI